MVDDGAHDQGTSAVLHVSIMAGSTRLRSVLPLVVPGLREQARPMLLITCPFTGTDELVADRRIRSVTNHPMQIALAVDCPCGQVHVYRTGRRWEDARTRAAGRATGRAAAQAAVAAVSEAARAARVAVPA